MERPGRHRLGPSAGGHVRGPRGRHPPHRRRDRRSADRRAGRPPGTRTGPPVAGMGGRIRPGERPDRHHARGRPLARPRSARPRRRDRPSHRRGPHRQGPQQVEHPGHRELLHDRPAHRPDAQRCSGQGEPLHRHHRPQRRSRAPDRLGGQYHSRHRRRRPALPRNDESVGRHDGWAGDGLPGRGGPSRPGVRAVPSDDAVHRGRIPRLDHRDPPWRGRLSARHKGPAIHGGLRRGGRTGPA